MRLRATVLWASEAAFAFCPAVGLDARADLEAGVIGLSFHEYGDGWRSYVSTPRSPLRLGRPDRGIVA
ncbi:hypothetical protein AoKodu_09230 [Actinomyces oris K20]|nr:hypothetical protein AoKodu_09230 [Actinomyces oris K20]